MTHEAAGQRFFDVSAGERTVPGIWHENYWFRRHEVVYDHVTRLLGAVADDLGRPPVVLDAGCGEGYGTTSLATTGAHVVGLDYDAWTTGHLALTYPDLPALRGNLAALPLVSSSIDVLVSLQTIEHVWDQAGFVAECARVLRPAGLLVLSTPNRRTFPPGNVFHHRELDDDELTELVASCFVDVDVVGVQHGPRLRAWQTEHGSLVDAQISSPPQDWPSDLRELVSDVRSEDFVLTTDTRDSLDLLATARRAR